MYKATTFNMAAEICWIDPNTLETLITEARETWNTSKLIELIKNDKFWNQIIKPLTDYKDNHVLANEQWQEYPKVPKKDKKWKVYYEYDWDIISADLLIWRRVQVQDWVKAEANETFVESKWTTVTEYVFNDTIPDHLKDWAFEYWKEGRKAIRDWYIEADAREQIGSIWNTSKAAKDLIEAVENKKTDISKEIEKFQRSMDRIQALSNGSNDFATELRSIVERLDDFSKKRLKGPPYSYEDIGKELWAIRKDMEGLIKYLV